MPTVEQMIDAGKCFACIPPRQQKILQNYLLSQIRGSSQTVEEIVASAQRTFCCVPPELWPRLKTYLACEMANASGTLPAHPTCQDDDADAFIAAAGLTDETQIGAVCELVTALKTYPAAGTKYWDRAALIYPFVGGNAVAHAVNLKSPGTYDLQFLGGGFSHSDAGTIGNGTTAYANTQYVIPVGSQNNFFGMTYVSQLPTVNDTAYFGCQSGSSFSAYYRNALALRYYVMDNTITSLAGTPARGIIMIERFNAANKQASTNNLNWVSAAVASAAPSIRYIGLFCIQAGGVAPAGVPSAFSNARICSASFGTPLDTGGGNTERVEYKGIWDTFNMRLGRGFP